MLRYVLFGFIAGLAATPAQATPPCDYFAMIGAFRFTRHAERWAERYNASKTWGGTEFYSFTPRVWHVYRGPFPIPEQAEQEVRVMRSAGVSDAFVATDCSE